MLSIFGELIYLGEQPDSSQPSSIRDLSEQYESLDDMCQEMSDTRRQFVSPTDHQMIFDNDEAADEALHENIQFTVELARPIPPQLSEPFEVMLYSENDRNEFRKWIQSSLENATIECSSAGRDFRLYKPFYGWEKRLGPAENCGQL